MTTMGCKRNGPRKPMQTSAALWRKAAAKSGVHNGRMTRKQLVAKIERLHPAYIRTRDGNQCVICKELGRPMRGGPQCGHLFTRVNRSTRWDVTPDGNTFCQCAGCNQVHEYQPYHFIQWYIRKFGQEKLDALFRRHNTVKNWSLEDLEDLLAFLRASEAGRSNIPPELRRDEKGKTL